MLNQAVFAAIPETNDTTLTESVDKLIEVKDDKTISEAERSAKELEARKLVVSDALKLSLKEVADLEKKLSDIKTKDESVASFIKVSLEYLANAKNFYEEKQNSLASLTDLEEVKNAAKELKDYRDNGYNAKIERMGNFLLLLQIQDLIATTQTRWNKISADLKKLERGQFITSGFFNTNMQKAQKYINDAAGLSKEAKDRIIKETEAESPKLLGAGAGEPTITSAPQTITETPTKAEIAKEEAPVVNPKELVEASLTNLKSSYDIFLKISQNVKKILQ